MATYPFLNYAGSSGYGPLGEGGFGGFGLRYTPPPATDTRPDYPVFDITTGKLKSRKTGKEWIGALPQGWSNPYTPGATEQGVQVPYAPPGTTINPNDPTQRYRPVDIIKAPDIAQGEQDLMKTFKDSAAASLKDFSQYLNNFKTDLGTARTAAAAATDIAPTVSALQAGQEKYAAGLTADQAALADLLKSNAAAEQGIVTQATGILPQYDAAAKAVADQQMAAVQQQLSRYKMGTGTPTSGGSDEERLLAAEAAKVYAPFEQAKIDRQLSLLTGLALPVQQDITNRQTAALTQFNPAAQAAIWSSGRATAQDVQNLKNAVANMTYSQALQFMQAAQVPANIMQQILSGQIAQLGGLSQLEEQSRYRGLQDILGVYNSQPQSFDMSTPPLPSYNPNVPRYSQPNPGAAGGGGGGGGYLSDLGGGYGYRPLMGSIGGTPFAPNAPITVNSLPTYATTGQNPASYLGGMYEGTLVPG